MRFKQGVPDIQLSVEHGTSEVPDDGRYYVILAGDIIFSAASKRKALDVYGRERDRLFAMHGRPAPVPVDRERWLREERVNADLRAMHAEWQSTVGANARRKGGKGGRGGVA
jgi:hypothetical protein